MEVLFICKSNFGRSQIAKAIFNVISKKHKAISAGTERGRITAHKLKEYPEHSNLFTCMNEIGFNISESITKFLTPEMARDADKIIVMAEKDTWPDYLKESDKIVFWEIEDMCGQSLDKFRDGRNQIKSLVEKLVKKIG